MFSDSYALIQRLLHWSIALLVICLLGVGWMLGEFGFKGLTEIFGDWIAGNLYKYHKTFGVIVLGLMVLRLICKMLLGRPTYSEPMPLFNRIASGAVHGMLYLVLLAMPILGWLGTAAGGFPVQFFEMKLPGLIGKDEALGKLLFEWHGIVGWVIIGLVGVHICAALYHWIIKRDRIMGRMSLF
ncbi:MAG: cytochrome b [Pseudomonadota bacterium]